MNLALLQQLGKLAGQLSDSTIREVATALGGSNATELGEFMLMLKTAEPETPVKSLLGSPTASRLLGKLLKAEGEVNNLSGIAQALTKPPEDNFVFVRCPECHTAFEADLSPSKD